MKPEIKFAIFESARGSMKRYPKFTVGKWGWKHKRTKWQEGWNKALLELFNLGAQEITLI
jgi:hypothetical protein